MVLGAVLVLVLVVEVVAIALTTRARRSRQPVRYALVLGALTLTAFVVGGVGCAVELALSFGDVAAIEPASKAATLAGDIDHAMAILVVGVIGAAGPAIGTLIALVTGRRAATGR